MPEAKRTGGCQCGAVRYELTGELLPLVICHCHECQKQSASAFGMSLPVARTDLRILSGELKEWRRVAESGREVACWFCPDCGSRIYHSSLLRPEYWHLKPGTLDDTSGSTWPRSGPRRPSRGWISRASCCPLRGSPTTIMRSPRAGRAGRVRCGSAPRDAYGRRRHRRVRPGSRRSRHMPT